MIRLYPGALDMIEALQEAGVVVALLSNAQACYTRPELEMTGLANVLDDVIISSEEKIRKPARDLYMLALDREFVIAKTRSWWATMKQTILSEPIPPVSTQHTSVRKFRR